MAARNDILGSLLKVCCQIVTKLHAIEISLLDNTSIKDVGLERAIAGVAGLYNKLYSNLYGSDTLHL